MPPGVSPPPVMPPGLEGCAAGAEGGAPAGPSGACACATPRPSASDRAAALTAVKNRVCMVVSSRISGVCAGLDDKPGHARRTIASGRGSVSRGPFKCAPSRSCLLALASRAYTRASTRRWFMRSLAALVGALTLFALGGRPERGRGALSRRHALAKPEFAPLALPPTGAPAAASARSHSARLLSAHLPWAHSLSARLPSA